VKKTNVDLVVGGSIIISLIILIGGVQIGSIPKMLGSIRSLELPAEEEAAILGGNAARLLGLPA
jgi:hypothetical protein